MSEWQPIETAPKDGTEIIGCFSDNYGYQDEPTVFGPWTIRWKGNMWVSSWDGYGVIEYMGDFGTDYKTPDVQPTHWLPLPEPPKE